MKKETISILGCGWYGLALAKALISTGHTVKGSTTNVAKLLQLKKSGIEPYLVNLANIDDHINNVFFKCDVLIVCIPPRKRESDTRTYIDQIKLITTLAANQVLFISSTGIYQDGNFIVDENTIPAPTSEVGQSLLAAETLLMESNSFTATVIRFGGLIGPERNLARHFAGKSDIANGLAPINLIHLDDCIGLTKTILRKKAFGLTYHGVAPSHPTRAEFYTRACVEAGLEKPEFIPELREWKQINSVLVPRVLKYEWKVLF